jgi:xylan 1,4-beta-xylosidase
VRDSADVSALASRDGNSLAVLAWHYHDDDIAGPAAAIDLSITGLPAGLLTAKLRHYRIDSEHSNAFESWKRMGSPATPTAEQSRDLETAGQLAELHGPQAIAFKDGAGRLSFTLPRQAVSLVVLEW